MAGYEIAAGQRGAYAKQLAANVEDTVTIDPRALAEEPTVEVWTDGTAAVYLTADGTDPTVASQGAWEIPAGAPAARDGIPVTGAAVKLISAGTPRYSVTITVS